MKFLFLHPRLGPCRVPIVFFVVSIFEMSDSSSSGDEDVEFERSARNGNPVMSDSFIPYFPKDLQVEKILERLQNDKYLVKYKGYSYLHLHCHTKSELLEMDSKNSTRIDRFENTDQSYSTKIDRVLGYFQVIKRQPDLSPFGCLFEETPSETNDKKFLYAYVLVKWEHQQYAYINWEPMCFVKDQAATPLDAFLRQGVVDEEMAKLNTSISKSNFRQLTEEEAPKLRDYQLEGVNWLLFNWSIDREGSLLADEMGLGKTIQAVTFLEELKIGRTIHGPRNRGPHLVVVPLSCLFQWKREFAIWTSLNVILFHGDSDSRAEIVDYEFYLRNSRADEGGDGRKIRDKEYFRFDVLVTTYEIAVREAPLLRKIPWRVLIVDEAHRLKNKESKLNRELVQYTRDYCMLLTGTPIQNNTAELWALMNFFFEVSKQNKRRRTESKELNLFESKHRELFLEKFERVTKSDQVQKLHGLLRPYLLRRVKEDVAKSLPPKEETIIEVELTVDQKKYYRGIYEKNASFLYKGGKPSNGPSLMNVVMELRKCCNHPFLNRGVEEALCDNTNRNEKLITSSGKLVLLDKLLPKLQKDGHRVLIFSQMVRMLDILQDFLSLRGTKFERLDGGITGQARQTAIDKFTQDESYFCMLLSTRAGGLGLNLACADTVIIFDSDWNPQNDLQAQARSHRIGQTKPVKIYRLLTRKTYENVLFQKASVKLGLDQAMLSSTKEEIFSTKDIDHVLKHGAYAAFGETEEESIQASTKFSSMGIDEILATSVIDRTPTANESSNAFSKAVFIKSTDHSAVDLDDPEFWAKVAGMEEPLEEDEANRYGLSKHHIINTQRERKSVARLGMISGDVDEPGSKNAVTRKPKQFIVQPRKHYLYRYLRDVKISYGAKSWSERSRNKLLDCVEKYGYGNWKAYLRDFNFYSFGDESQLETFAAACVKITYSIALTGRGGPSCYSPTETGLLVMNSLPEISSEDMENASKLLSKPAFVNRMLAGRAREFMYKLDLMRLVNQLCSTAENTAESKLNAQLLLQDEFPADVSPIFSFSVNAGKKCTGVFYGKTPSNVWLIRGVVANSSWAGFLKCGDVLTRINGVPTDSIENLVQFVDAMYSVQDNPTSSCSESDWEPEVHDDLTNSCLFEFDAYEDSSVAAVSLPDFSEPEPKCNVEITKIYAKEKSKLMKGRSNSTPFEEYGISDIPVNSISESIGPKSMGSTAILHNEQSWEVLLTNTTAGILNQTLKRADTDLLHSMQLKTGEYWTRQMDLHLILGIHRYGISNDSLNFIAADPSFVFARTIGEKKAKGMFKAQISSTESDLMSPADFLFPSYATLANYIHKLIY